MYTDLSTDIISPYIYLSIYIYMQIYILCVYVCMSMWVHDKQCVTHICTYESIFYPIYIYEAFNRFQDFFVQAFKIVIDSWKVSMLLLYIIWNDWPIFMISGSNELLQQQLEYTLLKPDCHSRWISKIQSGL